jgi:hypothetical protein
MLNTHVSLTLYDLQNEFLENRILFMIGIASYIWHDSNMRSNLNHNHNDATLHVHYMDTSARYIDKMICVEISTQVTLIASIPHHDFPNMSGYLPPHGTGGACSELYKPKYNLKKTDPKGEDEESSVYYTHLHSDVVPTLKTLIALGPDPDNPILRVHPLGFGLWGWGDVITYGWGPSNGYDQKLNDESVAGAWKYITEHSDHMLLDTAEHYGYTDGYSEKTVGQLLKKDGKETRSKIVYATKYFPTPWRHPWKYPNIIPNSAKGSLERSQVGKIDIYQLHGPSHWGFWPRLETICEGLCQAYEQGKCKAVGTCNLSFEQVKFVYTYLRKVRSNLYQY